MGRIVNCLERGNGIHDYRIDARFLGFVRVDIAHVVHFPEHRPLFGMAWYALEHLHLVETVRL